MSGQLRDERGTKSEVFGPSEPSSMTCSQESIDEFSTHIYQVWKRKGTSLRKDRIEIESQINTSFDWTVHSRLQ